MAIYKDKNKTKDGRQWYFKVYKKDFEGNNKPYKSKRYLTKKEAEEAEALFILKRDNPVHKPFELVANDYFESLDSTYYTYLNDYHNHIESYFKECFVEQIDLHKLKIWKEELEINTL